MATTSVATRTSTTVTTTAATTRAVTATVVPGAPASRYQAALIQAVVTATLAALDRRVGPTSGAGTSSQPGTGTASK